MEFRKMTLDDLDKVYTNLNNFDDFWTFGIFKKELTNPQCHYIVAIQDDDILGFGGISVVLDEANINRYFVLFICIFDWKIIIFQSLTSLYMHQTVLYNNSS